MHFSLPDFLQAGAIMSLSPHTLLISWGVETKNNQLKKNHQLPSYYFNDFFLTQKYAWSTYQFNQEIDLEKFEALLPNIAIPSINWTFDQADHFKINFENLKFLLKTQQLNKAVPYTFCSTPLSMSPTILTYLLKKSLQAVKNSHKFLYGKWNQQSGLLGLTPEILFNHQAADAYLSTMALAGTCHCSNQNDYLIESSKERREHALVVEGICQNSEKLGRALPDSIQVLKIPPLSHLLTPIKIMLKQEFNFENAVNCLHPTYALGASPKLLGKKWLENYQLHTPREYYGAPIGFNYPQSKFSQCLVGIRNLQWNLSGIRIGVGCGVIVESIFEQEWQEIQLKTQAIREQFGL